MRLGYFLFSFILLNTSYAACDKKITTKNVIFFIDMNGGTKELDEAKKAACDRGQKIVIYPEQTAAIYKLTNDKSFYENKFKALKCDKDPSFKGCKEVGSKKDAVIDQLKEKAVQFSVPDLKEKLRKLHDEQGESVENLVISGHSDGKTIFGVYGTAQREGIQTSFKDLPDKGKSVTSLVMLACYSANPSTILSWKKNLPELKMIAGSDASASASDRPAGLKYLRDLLMKMKQLTADADQESLKKRLKVLIPTLKEVNSAIYIDSNKCGEALGDKRFFYSKSSGGLNVFNPEECAKAVEKYKTQEDEIKGYMDGTTPIPTETHGTALREIYSFMRQNAHCLEAGEAQYTADMLYGLLFYHQVKINAIRALKKEADEVNALLKDFGGLKTWPLTEENIKNKSRKEILDNLEAISGMIGPMGGPEVFEAIEKLEWSLKSMTCVSPEWHDIQANPRTPLCAAPLTSAYGQLSVEEREQNPFSIGNGAFGGFGQSQNQSQNQSEEEQ